MSAWSERLEVARWEFQRFVKPKQLFWSVVITAAMGGVGYSFTWFAGRSERVEATVAVIGGDALDFEALATDGITLVPHSASAADSLRAEVAAGELDGLLIVRSSAEAELFVEREPSWHTVVQARLSEARQAEAMRDAGLTPDLLAELLAPVDLEIVEERAGGGGLGTRLAAIFAVGAVLYGIFTAVAYMFVSVTGEKQLRVAEQVLSTIPPQTWIDGKMIGLAGVAGVSVLTIGAGVIVFLLGRSIARGSFALPALAADPVALMLIMLFALLGFAFWLAFFGVVAATIDDPNTSTRGPLMFVPIVLSGAGFLILGNPDSTLARVLALLPPTSPFVVPARLATTDVPVLEIVLPALLLAGGTWLLRGAAGKVFAVGMLLYGKEPGWAEVRRWIRET